MANFDSCLLVEKAIYSNFSLVMATIHPVTLSSIKIFEEVIPASAVPEDVFMDKPDMLFMGIMTQKHQHQHAIVGFQLDEVSSAGRNTGKKFYVQVTNGESNDWRSNQTLLAARENEKLLFLLENIPFKINNKNEVHFSVLPGQGTIFVKQFVDSAFGVDFLQNQQHLTLTQAIARGPLLSECNVYGVVTWVLKKPTVTINGNFHGMILITDPSCYEVLPASQKPEFCVQFFFKSVDMCPNMNVGDVLRLKDISTRPRFRNPKETEFLVSTQNPGNQLIVFPSGDWEEPFGPYDRFYVTDQDIEVVEKLKRWYRDLSNYVDLPVLPQPPPPTVVKQEVAPDIQRSADENGPSTSQASYGQTGRSSLSQEDKVNLDCPSNGLSSQTKCSTASVPIDQSIDDLRSLLPTLPLEGQQRIIQGLHDLIETASQMTQIPTQEFPKPNSTIKEEFVSTDEPMNEFSFNEESEVVTWASEDPLPTETTSQLIPTHELVQPLSINIKVEQEAVYMEDSFLPEGDASMPQPQSPVAAPPISTIKMERFASDDPSQPFDANNEAVSQSQVLTQELILPPQFIKMEKNSEEDSMNEVLPSEGSAETPQSLNEAQELTLPTATIKEEFVSFEQPTAFNPSNDGTNFSPLTTKIKIETTEEPSQSSSEEEAVSFSDNSGRKQQSPLRNSREEDSIPQVPCKRIKIEPVESGVPFVVEMFSRDSQ